MDTWRPITAREMQSLIDEQLRECTEEQREIFERYRVPLRAAPLDRIRPLEETVEVTDKVRTTYRAVVRPAKPRGRVVFYPSSLHTRLPAIPIPLRPTDKDLPLDLQPLVDQVYRNGRYDRTRYDRPLHPPLGPDDAAWAAELLKSAVRNSGGAVP